MKTILLFSIGCLVFFACKKNEEPQMSEWPCDIIEDSASIAGKLPGSWGWTKFTCSNNQVQMADKVITVQFTADGHFQLKENSIIKYQGTWKLVPVVTAQWILELSSPSEYINGFVQTCGNQVLFADAYVDGCNNYFTKLP